MKQNPYRYVICACGTVLIFISVGLLSNVFPVYFPFIMQERHFSNTQVSLLTTMRTITALCSMFITDRYYARLNLKKGIALALCASVFSYLIYGLSSTPPFYYLAAAISGIGYGLGGMIPASLLIRRWFPVHAATAMGIAASGSGIASILGPVLITFCITRFGLSTAFLLEAGLMLLCAVPMVLLIRNTPQADAESESSPALGEPISEAGQSVLTQSEHLRVIFGVFLVGALGLTSFSGLSLLYTTTGHSIETVSSLLSFMGFLLITGKCALGWIADRLGNRTAILIFGSFLISGQFLCCLADGASPAFIAVTFLFLGMGLSVSTVALPILAADFCTPGRYAALIKTYQLTYALGGLLSSPFPGMIADRFGSYIPAYGIFFVISILVLLFIIPVYGKAKKRKD